MIDVPPPQVFLHLSAGMPADSVRCYFDTDGLHVAVLAYPESLTMTLPIEVGSPSVQVTVEAPRPARRTVARRDPVNGNVTVERID